MKLRSRIQDDIKIAMKASDAARLSALRLSLSAIKNKEIEKRGELADADVIQVLATLIKQRKESIELYTKGGRADLAQKEEAEIAVLQSYLPAALGEAELKVLIVAAIAEAGAAGPKDMGKVMKILVPKVQGRADGKLVSDLVKQQLSS